jgi:methionine-rich copper-binding protein CopC
MKIFTAALWLLVGLTLAGPASAHAHLERSLPRVGATALPAPSEVSLWFNEPLEAAFSAIQVFDANGKRVDSDDTWGDTENRKKLTVHVGPLTAGAYKVVWRVVAVDAHVTAGDFSFAVAP